MKTTCAHCENEQPVGLDEKIEGFYTCCKCHVCSELEPIGTSDLIEVIEELHDRIKELESDVNRLEISC